MTEAALEIKRVLQCSEAKAEARVPVAIVEDCVISLESIAGARLERGIVLDKEESHEPES